MLKKPEYPQTMLIELNALSNVVAYLLNEATGTNLLNPQNAYVLAVEMLRYNLNIRCLWLKCPNTYMNVVEVEAILMRLDAPPAYKEYLITTCSNEFMVLEDMVSDFLNPYVDKQSWSMWRVEEQAPAIRLINEGDYRIAQWADIMEKERNVLARAYPSKVLRSSR